MKELTKNELMGIMTIIENCLLCESREELKFDILIPLRQIIPHDVSVCCIGDASLKMKNIINIDYPKEFLNIYVNKLIFDDPLIKEWLSTWKPQIWSVIYQKYTKQKNPCLKSLSEDYNLTEGISHGFPDLEMRLATHFSFGRSPEKLSPRFARILEIVLPHVHQAFIRISRREGLLPSDPHKLEESKIEGIGPSLREIEVLKWAKEGKTNWEISAILSISERTVKFHMANILKKLDAVSRGHAVAKALELGLLQL